MAHDVNDILRLSCRDQLIDDVYTIKTTNMAETSGKQLSVVIFNDIFFDDWISEFIHASAQNARTIDTIYSVSQQTSFDE